jgi:hypothetical protein
VIGDVHFTWLAYCSGCGSAYAASGAVHATVLLLPAAQPTSKR